METQKDSIIRCSLLRRFVLDRIPEHGNQNLTFKTRLLNKERKQKIEKGINTAKINFSNIQQLIDSNLSCQIKYLHIFVRTKFENLEKLLFFPYATHFPSIKSINIFITKAWNGSGEKYYYGERKHVMLQIREPLFLQNVTINNKSDLDSLIILGKQFDVTIRDCKFDGLEIFCDDVAKICVCNTRSENSKRNGLTFRMFKLLKMENIVVNKSGGVGCHIYTDQGFVKITDICVTECALDGIFLRGIEEQPLKFEFENVHIAHSGNDGIYCFLVQGEIKNSSIKKCECYGINMKSHSVILYAAIQFEGNEEGNTYTGRNSNFKQISD